MEMLIKFICEICRLNKICRYNEDFEPMRIVERFMTWDEAEKYR